MGTALATFILLYQYYLGGPLVDMISSYYGPFYGTSHPISYRIDWNLYKICLNADETNFIVSSWHTSPPMHQENLYLLQSIKQEIQWLHQHQLLYFVPEGLQVGITGEQEHYFGSGK